MGQAESNLYEDLSLVCKRIEIRAYIKANIWPASGQMFAIYTCENRVVLKLVNIHSLDCS